MLVQQDMLKQEDMMVGLLCMELLVLVLLLGQGLALALGLGLGMGLALKVQEQDVHLMRRRFYPSCSSLLRHQHA